MPVPIPSRLREPLSALGAFALLTGLMAATATAAPPDQSALFSSLSAAAPQLDTRILAMALQARDCAAQQGLAATAQRLAVIDYSRPSTEPRLWVFDLAKPGLLFSEYVAHGRGTGDNLASRFSNDDGSHQSSLGLFQTAESYMGGHGYSLRMDGLEPGFNDRARDRSIVVHGAWYVDGDLAARQGRLGRSFGCPAVRPAIVKPLVDSLKDGQLLFAYYPDNDWLTRSQMLRCAQHVATRRTSAR